MKLLSTEQQTELQELLASLQGLPARIQAQVNYWAIELRPKRVRTPKVIDEEAALTKKLLNNLK